MPPSLQRRTVTLPRAQLAGLGGFALTLYRVVHCPQVHAAVRALRATFPYPRIAAIVAHGTAAEACIAYARSDQRSSSQDGGVDRKLVVIGSSHRGPDSSPLEPPPGWAVLSVHGANDEVVPLAGSVLHHMQHRTTGHALRVLPGAGHTFHRRTALLGTTISEWVTGARRVDGSDTCSWGLEAVQRSRLLDSSGITDLSKRRLPPLTVELLAAQLSDDPALTAELLLRGCALGAALRSDAVSTALVSALSAQRRLTRLELAQNALGGARTALVAVCGACPLLRGLGLASNALGEHPECLAQLLLHTQAITSLSLRDNGINPAGAALLGAALGHVPALSTLDVSANTLGAEGAAAVVDALRCHSSLAELDLCANGIGDRGAAAVARALRASHSLTRLSLLDNGITVKGIEHLAASVGGVAEEGSSAAGVAGNAAGGNVCLRELDLLRHPPCPPAPALHALRAALCRNRALAARDAAKALECADAVAGVHAPAGAAGEQPRTRPPPASTGAATHSLAASDFASTAALGLAESSDTIRTHTHTHDIPELEELLVSAELGAKVPAARAWCRAAGIDSVSQLRKLRLEAQFVASLQLKQGRKLRLLSQLRRAPTSTTA